MDTKQYLSDNQQNISINICILIEIYRVIMSTLLLLSIPQLCNGNICTITDSLVFTTTTFAGCVLYFNFLTMFSLLRMFYIEYNREQLLIKYLCINYKIPHDGNKKLNKLSKIIRRKIKAINKQLKNAFYTAIVLFIINIILSIIVITTKMPNNQSMLTLFISILYMSIRLNNSYLLISANKYTLHSAYIKINAQYNDLNKKYTKICNPIYMD
jgi:hypothetical protein